jgi:hypothetical protein
MEDKIGKINSEKNSGSPEYKAAISTLARLVLEVHKLNIEEKSKLEGEKTKILTDKVQENYYRRQAKRLNLELKRSRGKKWSYKNQLGYQIIEPNGDIMHGKNYELTIEEAAKFLDDLEALLKSS